MKTYKFKSIFLVTILLLFVVVATNAQQISYKSSGAVSDLKIQGLQSLESKEKDPHKATMLAVFLPGAGQIYNEKYWKLPIVYAGLGLSAYAILWNKKEMSGYQDELNGRLKNGDTTNFLDLTVAQLKSNRDFYRSNRDLSIISFVAFYALQIVDAAVDAHLSGFKVDEKISMAIEPKVINNRNLGLGVTFTF